MALETNTTPAPSPAILERNLEALWRTSPQAARLLNAASARRDVEFSPTEDGVPGLAIGTGPAQRLLASRRHPVEEGRRLADTVDLKKNGGIVVLGFGAGYHVQALAERLRSAGAIFIFEPDVGLLRAVLEHIDHSRWFLQSRICFLTDADDAGAIAAAVRGTEALLALGVQILEHPASRARLGDHGRRFADRFTSVIRAVRTTVATTLIQSEVTVRNALMNLDRYATCAGIADLAGAGSGRPAIVVSAGPSLRRNIDLLKPPGVRDQFIIIAVQTVLRQLLARGIRPHFVTALDYHEISRRFYEGLTRDACEGVTLVAEAKANPAILDAFPGDIRIIADQFLDTMLGLDLARPMGSVKPGATVAHLAYYLARHMGCDPVILMGQDLGFTDGQYYAAGAAIHEVWAGELSPFNSLEMMEWQRIARGRARLHKVRDILGRPIYTDEQMATYQVQFERDFGADAQAGLTTIDATEGGVEKQHTRTLPLADALNMHAPPPGAPALRLPHARSHLDPTARTAQVEGHVRRIRQDVWNITRHSRRTQSLLQEMLDHHLNQPRVNALIAEVNKIRDEVEALQPAFSLVNFLNQAGTFKRFRADRGIELEDTLTPMERQRRQIERDIENVRWLGDVADRLGEILDHSIRALGGAPKATGEPLAPPDAPDADESIHNSANARSVPARRTVAACITLDLTHSGLGTPRDLQQTLLAGRNPLRLTLERLARSRELDAILLLTDDPAQAASLVGKGADIPRLKIIPVDLAPMVSRRRAILGSRLWTRSCWRGGLGSLSVYDEACVPALLSPVMESHGLDAAAIVGADWSLIDPGLVDAAIERFRLRPSGTGAHRLTFCQAAPGLGACVVERTLMRELATRGDAAGAFATIGGLLGYMPLAPVPDPIALPVCVTASPPVRDVQVRIIPDSEPRRAALIRALGPLGEQVLTATAEEIASRLAPTQLAPPEGPPQELVIELCTGRRTSGARARWMAGGVDPIERPVMPAALADQVISEFASLRRDAAITFAGAGDPLLHPDLFRIVQRARKNGIAGIHIRTDLVCDHAHVDALLDSGVDVISVDLMAESAAIYRTVMGADLFERVRGNLEHLLARRATRSAPGLAVPWVVARMTRCDAVYEEIESFFDRWILTAGAAVIDPLPVIVPGERIEPLPLPRSAARRMARERMTILSDGRVPSEESDFAGERCVGRISREGLLPLWRALTSRRFDAPPAGPSFSTDAVIHGSPARARTAALEATP